MGFRAACKKRRFIYGVKEKAEEGTSKNIMTMQNKIDVLFSIKDRNKKCLQTMQDHVTPSKQELHIKTNIFMLFL